MRVASAESNTQSIRKLGRDSYTAALFSLLAESGQSASVPRSLTFNPYEHPGSLRALPHFLPR